MTSQQIKDLKDEFAFESKEANLRRVAFLFKFNEITYEQFVELLKFLKQI